MVTFAELAIAAADAAQKAADTAVVEAARTAVTPVLTDAGKVLLDPKTLTLRHRDVEGGVVVLATPDNVYFAVRAGTVRITWLEDGAWRDGPIVKSVVDVGLALKAQT